MRHFGFIAAGILVFVCSVASFGFTIDGTSRYITGPLTLSKDTVFENGFVSGYYGDTLKIINTTVDTLTIDSVVFFWDTTKINIWGIHFSISPANYDLRESAYSFCAQGQGDGFIKIRISKNEEIHLHDFWIDLFSFPLTKTTANSQTLQKQNDTMIIDMVLFTKAIQETIKDTITIIGVQSLNGSGTKKTFSHIPGNAKIIRTEYFSLNGRRLAVRNGRPVAPSNTLVIVRSIDAANAVHANRTILK
jgi:hypothetical protein